MKKTFKKFMVVLAVLVILAGGIVTINIDPPLPPKATASTILIK